MIGGQGLASDDNCGTLFRKNWRVISVIVAIAISWGSVRSTLSSQAKRLDRIDRRIDYITQRIDNVLSNKPITKAHSGPEWR